LNIENAQISNSNNIGVVVDALGPLSCISGLMLNNAQISGGTTGVAIRSTVGGSISNVNLNNVQLSDQEDQGVSVYAGGFGTDASGNTVLARISDMNLKRVQISGSAKYRGIYVYDYGGAITSGLHLDNTKIFGSSVSGSSGILVRCVLNGPSDYPSAISDLSLNKVQISGYSNGIVLSSGSPFVRAYPMS
jgi:hypothetical protein